MHYITFVDPNYAKLHFFVHIIQLSNTMQTNTYLAGQKTATPPNKDQEQKQKHNGADQITPSKEGASD